MVEGAGGEGGGIPGHDPTPQAARNPLPPPPIQRQVKHPKLPLSIEGGGRVVILILARSSRAQRRSAEVGWAIAPLYPSLRDYRSMTASTESAVRSGGKPRIAAEVALALLEVIQQQDSPTEVFQDEDVSATMPRRLGLSEVVDRQVRLQRDNARKGRRLSDSELIELMRLVMKRPDAPEVFFEAGARLGSGLMGGGARVLPKGLRTSLVKRRVSRRLKRLFGRRIGLFQSGPFAFEGSGTPFAQVDTSGSACQVVAGVCQQALSDGWGRDVLVVEQACEARGDTACRWAWVEEERPGA